VCVCVLKCKQVLLSCASTVSIVLVDDIRVRGAGGEKKHAARTLGPSDAGFVIKMAGDESMEEEEVLRRMALMTVQIQVPHTLHPLVLKPYT